MASKIETVGSNAVQCFGKEGSLWEQFFFRFMCAISIQQLKQTNGHGIQPQRRSPAHSHIIQPTCHVTLLGVGFGKVSWLLFLVSLAGLIRMSTPPTPPPRKEKNDT